MDSHAQYKNNVFGIEAGHIYAQSDILKTPHAPVIAIRGGHKISDKFWITSRVGLAPNQNAADNNTLVLIHLVPIEIRHYFKTDSFRPFVGLASVFNLTANKGISSVFWGAGPSIGAEFKLKRDIFLGLQADGSWMFSESESSASVRSTLQLIFFL